MYSSIGIKGIGYSVPERVVSNEEIAAYCGYDLDVVSDFTLIEERRWATDDQAFTDFAIDAARKAMEDAGVAAEEIKILIVATSSDDYYNPRSGAYIQHVLGLKDPFVLNIDQSCAGPIYALSAGAHLMNGMKADHALVIAGDCGIRMVEKPGNLLLGTGGDGCGAVVLGRLKKGKQGFLSECFGSAGEFYKNFGIYNFGSRIPRKELNEGNERYTASEDGNIILFRVLKWFKTSFKSCLKEAGLKMEDVSFISPHPAAISQIKLQMRAIKADMEKTNLVSRHFGHSGGGTHFIILQESLKEKRIKAEDIVFMFGNGSGFLWGGILIKWCDKADFISKEDYNEARAIV